MLTLNWFCLVEDSTEQHGFLLLPVSFLKGAHWLFLDQLSVDIRPPALKHLQKAEGIHHLWAWGHSKHLIWSLSNLCSRWLFCQTWRRRGLLDLICAFSTAWGLRDRRHSMSNTEQLAVFAKFFPSFRDSCLRMTWHGWHGWHDTDLMAWHGSDTYVCLCVCVFTEFSEEWRRVNSGKRPVWRAVCCSGSSDVDWPTEHLRSRQKESPEFTQTHTYDHYCLIKSWDTLFYFIFE